mgnify:CR=1 FL=1
MANDTWIIAGLGNPGDKYAYTWHNCGFLAMELLADKCGISMDRTKFDGLYGKGKYKGKDVILLKPQTFMNLSGESVRELMDYYKIDEEEELIVVYDDISLEPGQLRIRKKGSAGGHNGIKNIIQHLGHDVFKRVKVGVGEKPKGYDLADYVLGQLTGKDHKYIDETALRVCDAIELLSQGEVDEAMNRYNG